MITFTKAERNAIALAWSHLDSHAMPSGFRARINDAVSIERKGGFSDRIGTTQARAMVINWFYDGYQGYTMHARDIAGIRISAAVATLCGVEMRWDLQDQIKRGCTHSPHLSAEGVAAIAEACRAYQAASERARNA